MILIGQSSSKKDPQKKLRASIRRLSRSTESLQKTKKKLKDEIRKTNDKIERKSGFKRSNSFEFSR